jgi:hypothetical protein
MTAASHATVAGSRWFLAAMLTGVLSGACASIVHRGRDTDMQLVTVRLNLPALNLQECGDGRRDPTRLLRGRRTRR